MSFDLFVQGFRDGDARLLPLHEFDTVFAQYIDHQEPEHGYHHLRTSDGGEADLYARPDADSLNGFMINHVPEGQILDLVVEFARRADAVLMPIGCPTLVIDQQQAQHLPSELQDNTLTIATGADIAAALKAAD